MFPRARRHPVRRPVGDPGRSHPNEGSRTSGFLFHLHHPWHKAPAVAIAGALAAPTMAAQAVDFTLSGQVGRTFFINDSDTSTNPMSIGSDGLIRDNNGATRVRANGSSELEDGSRIGIQFEMGWKMDPDDAKEPSGRRSARRTPAGSRDSRRHGPPPARPGEGRLRSLRGPLGVRTGAGR